jgi:hypothetical protein
MSRRRQRNSSDRRLQGSVGKEGEQSSQKEKLRTDTNRSEGKKDEPQRPLTRLQRFLAWLLEQT